MRKLAFLQKEPLSRLGVALLLTAGVALPLLLALDLGSHAPGALLLATLLLVLLTVLNASAKSRRLLWVLLGATAVSQLFFPGLGLFGDWLEAFKALALYFSSYTVALPLYGAQVAGLIAVLSAVLSYVFAKRGVGFLPAALIVVLVMFGLWSLGKGSLLWYVAPALVALLLQMSQAAHDKINVLHVLPMALVTVLLAFLLLPGARLTIDPLAKAASSLKQAITDYLFFTEPRNVFTLGSYGYYPMGGSQLGGKAEPSEYPVMMVKTDRKTLLRAVAKDQYNGRSFVDTSSAKRYLYINPRWQAQRRKVFMELLPSDAIRKASALLNEKAVTVQMQNRAASTVFTPLFVRKLTMTNDMVPYFNDSSELFITRDLALGDRYTIFAPVFEGGDAGLDALVNASLKNDEYYQDIYNAYTQLPSHMEQKVFDDVGNIVRGESTPYGKAMAIMRHLQKYYRYSLNPGNPPLNNDFVTYFLYVGKEGYCTYYASAMTVMCRMANLPARYVEGFMAQPSADGFAYVTGKEAHAWTEVYFEGFGWIPFDPTPSQQNGANNPPPEGETEPSPSPSPDDQPTPTPDPAQPSDEPSDEPQPSDEPDQPPEEDAPDTSPDSPPDIPWLALLGLAALTALLARIALRTPDRVARRMATEKDKVFVYGAAVQRLLTYAKRGPRNGETPLAFARRVDSVRVFPTPIAPLWRILALSNYSRVEPAPEQTQRARDTFRLVFKGSHALRKLRFLLTAAFDPRFYRALETPAPHDPPPQPPMPKITKTTAANRAAYAPRNATLPAEGLGNGAENRPRVGPDGAPRGPAAENPRSAGQPPRRQRVGQPPVGKPAARLEAGAAGSKKRNTLARPAAADIHHAPARPAGPDKGRIPAAPAAQDNSRNPARPAAPDMNRTPARPAAPDMSRTPARPAAPDINRTPARPAAPDMNRTPARPTAPGSNRTSAQTDPRTSGASPLARPKVGNPAPPQPHDARNTGDPKPTRGAPPSSQNAAVRGHQPPRKPR